MKTAKISKEILFSDNRIRPEEPFDFDFFILSDFPRLVKIRQKHLSSRAAISTDRAHLITEFFRKEGFNEDRRILQQARAVDYLLQNVPIAVFEDDLIIGSTTKYRIGSMIFPEFLAMSMWPELLTISTRKLDPVDITEEQIDLLAEEIFPFWKDYTILEWAKKKGHNPLSLQLQERFIFYLLSKSHLLSHLIPDYQMLINRGLEDVIGEAKNREETTDDIDKKEYYAAVQISLKGVINLANRYALECEEKAKDCNGPRAEELKSAASILRNVPARPARTFQEALQSIWITLVAIHQENFHLGMSLGRFDQFLYPFYKKDIEEGIINQKKAMELVGAFFIKISDVEPFIPTSGHELFSSSGTEQAVTVGGIKPDGSDGVNELTYLIMKITELITIGEPNLTARVHPGSPPLYRKKIIKTIYNSGAEPGIFNDEAYIKSLTNEGISLEEARDYGIVSCVEPHIQGKTFGLTGGIMLNLVAILELALYNGVHPLSNMQIGPQTGDFNSFKSFDDFLNAYKTQLEYIVSLAVEGNSRLAEAHKYLHPTPLLSALIDGTMESGREINWGGAKYNFSGFYVTGLADVADSLTALKMLVFDEPRISKGELMAALSDDFKGHEKTHALLTRKAPKYGMDDDVADEMASELVTLVGKTISNHKNPRGGPFHVGYWSITIHAGLGVLTGALPSGRRKGKHLASGSTPVSGVQIKGPTASMASTAKLPNIYVTNGMTNNHKLSKSFLSQPGKLDIFEKLVFGYLKRGGMQIQFNIRDKETLLEAQKHPEDYRDLLVRVSGYTAYFCGLNRHMQSEIIARCEDQI